MSEHETPLQDPNTPKSFHVDDVKISLEKGKSYPLLEFPFKDKKITIFVTVFFEVPNYSTPKGQEVLVDEKRYVCELGIYDENDNHLGNIRGTVIYDGRGHVSASATNLGLREEKDGVSYLKGVVSESICQMLMNKVFEVWYSSSHLMPDGQDMYESVAEQLRKRAPNIEIFPEDSSYDNDGESKRWKFVRK